MSAQLKEIVADTDILHLQKFGPNGSERLLGLGVRPDEIVSGLYIFVGEIRKRLAINLAVRGQRKLFHQDKRRRDHVLRQPLFQILAQCDGCQHFFVHGWQ